MAATRASAGAPAGAVPPLIGLLAGALYVRLANPAVGGGNTGEFQVMAHLLGIAHPPSYPLYLLLAKGASLLPLPGDVAWRINVLTAVLGGVAVALAGFLALAVSPKAGSRSRKQHGSYPNWDWTTPATSGALALGRQAALAAAVTAVALATMPRLWTLAVEAEVFTLHLALVLGFWLALLRWREAPDRSAGRWLLLAAFLAGLGLANHRTFLFVFAGGLLTVLLTVLFSGARRWPSLRRVVGAAACFGLGLAPYLYVLRGLLVPVPYFDPTDVHRLTRGEVWYVLQGNASGETGGGAIVLGLLRDPPLLLDRTRWLVHHVTAQLGLAGPPVALLGLAGLALVWRRRPAWTTGAVCGAAGAALFGMAYGKYPDADRYLLPLHALTALGLGSLTAALAGALDRALGGGARRAPGMRAVAGGAAGLLLGAYFALPLGVLAGQTTFTRGGYVYHTLHNLEGVAPDAVVCSWWASAWGWWYAQWVDGHRRDVRLVPKGPDECARDVVPQELGRHPVYLPGLTDKVRSGAFAYFPSRDLWLAVGPKVEPEDGALLKGPDERIYLVQGGQRRWVPTLEVFAARGFSWDGVRLTPPYVLQEIPEGPPLAA
jgi:Protein O-mannosyl-transferase TMEM260-like